MDPQKPDPQYDPYDRAFLLDGGGRFEDDTLKPLTPIRNASRNKLPAAVSFAVVGLLAVGGMAFGANVVMPMIGARATPIVVPDETEPPAAIATLAPTDVPEATVAPSEVAVVPVADPTATPTAEPTAEPTASPTPKATVKPTAKPTLKPATPKPIAAGPVDLGNLAVTDKGNGCYRFSWQGYSGVGFNYWKLVHGDWGTSPYYPAFPYWAVLDPGTTSWEGCVDPGDYAVRVQAIYYPNGDAKAAAQTAIIHLVVGQSAPPAPTVDMGNLGVSSDAAGCYTFTWPGFSAVDFDYWKLVHGPWGTSPTYPDFPYWAALNPGTTSFKKCNIPAGDYAVRVQAIYYPRGAAYPAAQTQVYHLTVAASATPTPKPAPVALTLAATATTDGIALNWSKYAGGGFEYYKVVRSESNPSPTYPENDGTTLAAAISDVNSLSWTDSDAVPGTTYHYRVVAYNLSSATQLGLSNVITATRP